MPKKTKPKVKRKRKVRPQAQRRGVPPHPTIQQQFAPIHNQALKNSQRDNQQAQAKAEAEEKEFKMDTLRLQRAYVEKKLSLL